MSTGLVFTAVSAPRTQAVSETFKQYGITNEVASPMREVAMYPVSRPMTLQGTMLVATIVSLLQAAYLKADIPTISGAIFKSIINVAPQLKEIFSPPEIVISFGQGNLKDENVALATSCGFRKEVSGRRTYFRGSPSMEVVTRLARAGVDMNTYAPFGATNIHGYSAFKTAQKILLGVCSIIDPSTSLKYLNFDTPQADKFTLDKKTYTLRHFSSITDTEHLLAFPYFDGLCLPDKTTVPGIFSRYFMHLFGDSQDKASAAFKLFCSGWNSLATTAQGVAITHFATIVEIAILTGARPKILLTGRVYGGMILIQEGLTVMKNGVQYSAKTGNVVREALRNLDTHTSAVKDVLAILNGKLFTNEDEYIPYSKSITPRFLHNIIRTLNLDPESTKSIRNAALKFKFANKYWDPLSNDDIVKAIKAMTTGEELDDNCPISFRTEALFTKDNLLSVLSAFGPMAPSIVGKGSTYSVVINGKETMKPSMPGQLKLGGFPIFLKPLQEAHEDWKTVRSSSTITFKLRHHDKKPPAIMGLSKLVPFPEGGDKINDRLSAWSDKGKLRAEKRKREEDKEEPTVKERGKKIKSVPDVTVDLQALGFFDDVEDAEDSNMS